MDHGHTDRAAGPGPTDPPASAGSAPVDARELIDELGPIPTFPPLRLDPETGHMIPLSDGEIEARRAAAMRMLKHLDQVTGENDTDEAWREVYRNIDASRPHRPLFEELY